jgi:hypothetical protein
MIDSSTIAGALTVETAKMYILLIKFLTKKKKERERGVLGRKRGCGVCGERILISV